ncbi:transposase [Enterococcus caccae]|nr:transposase [Enterococcus caccae]
MVIKSTREAGEYLFRPEFLVTNLQEIPAQFVHKMYQNRGVMENDIKEIKTGFFFDKTNHSKFFQNATWMMVSGIAYNLIQMMKAFTFPKSERTATISTIRFKLFRVASKVTNHTRKVTVHLSSTNVFDRLFWQVLHRIQTFPLY